MALVSGFSQSTKDLLGQTQSIRSSLLSTKKSFNTINKVFERRTRIKATIFKNRKVQNDRKLEALARREQREASQAIKFTIAKNPSPRAVLQKSGKTFLGRLMDFISSLAIGWILGNLPTWIKWSEAFIKRVGKVVSALSSFTQSVAGFVKTLAANLGTIIGQIASFKFSELPETVNNAMNQLNTQFQSMQTQFEKGFALFDDPLIDESELSLPEQESQPTPQEQSGVSVSGYDGRSYESTGGQKITRSMFGNRGFRTRDGLGSGATAFGHTGRDVGMPEGTPLSIVSPGVVVDVSTGYNGGYGNLVVIKLDDGRYIKINHLSKILVKKGDRVGPGTGEGGGVRVIGLVGSTGLSTGPHMHLDLGTGYNPGPAQITGLMDPDGFILGGGVVKGGNVKSSGQTTGSGISGQPSQPQQSLVPGAPAPSGGTLSTAQLVALAKQVGMTQNVNVKGYSGPLSVLMGAVGMQESRGKSTSMRSDTEVYGLWQIRWPVHAANLKKIGITSPQQLYDPLLNAKAAKMIYDSQGITAWSGFTDGNYKKFLPEAQKAAGISPAQFTSAQQGNVPGSITPSNEGEVVFAEFPASGVSVSPGTAGGGSYGGGGGGGGADFSPPQQSESQVLNNFIKNKLLVELSYL